MPNGFSHVIYSLHSSFSLGRAESIEKIGKKLVEEKKMSRKRLWRTKSKLSIQVLEYVINERC